jgi:hypothetical protein
MALCRVNGCEGITGKSGTARGLCSAHYHRFLRYGDENASLRRPQSWNGAECRVAGCGKQISCKGLCEAHYAAHRRRTNPEAQRLRNQAWIDRKNRKQELLMGRPRPDTCEMCGNGPSGRGSKPGSGICFDHDHETGAPRGWLCDRCNKVLGLVKDSPELLYDMAAYLEAHSGKAYRKAA